MNEKLIQAQGIEKMFGVKDEGFTALKNVSLSINRGDLAVIYGPSGAGKSTLLHILSSLDRPTAGDVSFREKSYNSMADNALASMRALSFGFVFQFHYLLSEFSILENVLMPARISGRYSTEKAELRTRTIEVLSQAGIGHKADNFPNQVSGGESQRAAIARALLLDPEIVFMDEPTGNLDRKTGRGIIDLISEINKIKKISFVIVSHDEAVLSAATRRINLIDGVIV